MADMNALKYTLDGEPVSARDLISLAECLDGAFANDRLKRTSSAANILREHGHVVANNPEYVSTPAEDNRS